MKAATSRKLIRRALYGGAQSEEETRAYLQERVTLLFKLMFWSLMALMAFLASTYELVDSWRPHAPELRHWVYVVAAAGLAPMAFIWRGLLVRKQLSIEMLYRLDLTYSFFIGLSFGLSAYLQRDLIPSGYLSLIYSTFTVFSRTLIIPSTWRRTAATTALTYTPMTIAAFALSFHHQDMPGPMYFAGYLLMSIAPILLATAGSDIIYGLRQKASAAQLGQYTLDRKIGAGGMGTVYLAHHLLLRRPTAIKLVQASQNADALERFEREVQTMSQLTHPNTVAVYDYGHSLDGRFYYAMEYLGGGIDLDKLIKKRGPQPSARVAQILAQVCGALHEAHRANLIHRDIKPANIILCERGGMPDVAKVVDFGLVKELTVDSSETGQVVLGTPDYMAPEAITDPNSIGPGVDIYALGAVAYFMVTGKPVFTGKTNLDVCIHHVNTAPTPPSGVVAHAIDPALEMVIMRCLAKSPADRYASAADVAIALRGVPPTEWSAAQARAWWREYRSTEQRAAEAAHGPTLTVQVDLAAAARGT